MTLSRCLITGRISRSVVLGCSLVLLGLTGSGAASAADAPGGKDVLRAGPTLVSGVLPSNTVWVASNSPYVVTANITVPDNVTLTVSAGVVVKFQQYTGITVNGTIQAQGAPGDSVVFTAYTDDSYAGDTNGGGPSTGTAGYWGAITLTSPDADCTFSYTRIRYAGYSASAAVTFTQNLNAKQLVVDHSIVEATSASSYGAVYGQSASRVVVTNSQLRRNTGRGLYCSGAAIVQFWNSNASDNTGDGVNSTSATSSVSIRSSRIERNGGAGLYITTVPQCEVFADTIRNNTGEGLWCQVLPSNFINNMSDGNGRVGWTVPADAVDDIWLNNTPGSNGRNNAIGVYGGNVTASTTWIAGHPFLFAGTTTAQVSAGATLTLQPGVVCKFAGNGLQVSGALMAVGTPADSIAFTSANDDHWAGDTDGYGPSVGSPGGWTGISLNGPTADCSLSYCAIRYGGYSYSKMIDFSYGSGGKILTMDHCVVERSANSALYGNPGNPSLGPRVRISDSVIRANLGAGASFDSAVEVQMQRCVVQGNGGAGIDISRGGSGGFVVTDCQVSSNGGFGISILPTAGTVQLYGNTSQSNSGTGIACSGVAGPFYGNTSTDNLGFGYSVAADQIDDVWLANTIGTNGRGNAIGIYAGTVSTPTQWVHDYPYVVLGTVTVADQATLNLEAGSLLKFDTSIQMTVNGALIAAGTDVDPIVFTSYKDDSYGDDTNENGPSVGTPGDWYGLQFTSPDLGTSLTHAIVRFAGYPVSSYGRYGIYLTGAGSRLTLANCLVERTATSAGYTGNAAIYGGAGTTLDISECDIRQNQGDGIAADGQLNLFDSHIHDNEFRHGVRCSTAGWIAVDNVIENNMGEGLDCTLAPGQFHDNVAQNNALSNFVVPAPIVPQVWLVNTSGGGANGGSIGVNAGTIPATVQWTDEHPYAVFGDITIPDYVTLSLEAGATFKFGQYYKITVNGTLVANGTDLDPIVFTSIRDDAFGGDTDGGGATSGVPGDWTNIDFVSPEIGSSLSFCRVRYGGRQHGADLRESVSLQGTGAQLTMSNTTVDYSNGGGTAAYAVRSYAGTTLDVSRCVFRNNQAVGLYALGTLTLLESQFIGNVSHAFYVPVTTATIDQCRSENNLGYGAYVHPQLVGTVASRDTLVNNAYTNCIAFPAGSITLDDEWRGGTTYLANGTLTIATGATLVLNRGSVVKFNGAYGIEIRGSLVAQGDAVEKVVFTSYKDDAYGGDTNGDGLQSTAARGDWKNLYFNAAGSGSHLGWTVVSYAGNNNEDAVYVNGCDLDFENCIVAHNLDRGLSAGASGHFDIAHSDIYDNTYGVENLNATQTVDARNCYWGYTSGPYHPTSNSSGQGNRVSNNVLFSPWLERSVDNPWIAFTSPALTGNYMDVLIYDLDHDPYLYLDMVAATAQNGIQVFRRTGFESWQAVSSPITSGQVLCVDSGDINNDGIEDLLTAGPYGIRCFLNDGTGNLTETQSPLSGTGVTDAKFCNLNHDAWPDVVATSGSNQGVWTFYGDGAGQWTAGPRPATSGNYNRLAIEDLNRDTWPDLVATSSGSGGIRSWYGSATGTWTPGTPISNGSAFFAVDVGDIDGDGNFEMAVGANQTGIGIRVYRNVGYDTWTSIAGPTSQGIYNDIVLADLNGDTRLDLAAASQGGGIGVWVGTSGGNWNYWYGPISTNIFNRLCVADFTLNGSLDLAGASTIYGIKLWDNQTPGIFQEYFSMTPDRLDFGDVMVGRCAVEEFNLANVSPDTLRNVVVYTTNPAFQVTLAKREAGPFTMLPGENLSLHVTYCPTAGTAENEAVVIHSTIAATYLRLTGRGVPYLPPSWDVDLRVTNATGGPGNYVDLTFGVGIGASDSLDVEAGELCLPPVPPTTVFDARMEIAGCESMVDIRDFYTESHVYTVQWQAGAAGYPVTISWNPALLPAGTYVITDLMGGAFVDSVNMADVSQIVIPPSQSFLTQMAIVSRQQSTFTFHVQDGWQLLSRPITTGTNQLSQLFPGAVSAFTWTDQYVQVSELGEGYGYWVDMGADATIPHTGSQVTRVDRNLPIGWSLVGAPWDTVLVSQIQQSPPSSIVSVFGFQGGYFTASRLVPGAGYWFNLTRPCQISIVGSVNKTGSDDGGDTSGADSSDSLVSVERWTLPVRISAGPEIERDSRNVIFGFDPVASVGIDPGLGERALPPRPPAAILDGRLTLIGGNDVALDLRPPVARPHRFEILWQPGAAGYPVTLQWDPAAIPAGMTFTLRDNLNGAFLGPVDMRAQGEVVVPEELAFLTGVAVEVLLNPSAVDNLLLPRSFALEPPSPNPQRDGSTIRFQLPRETDVRLAVYDLSGRQVRLVAQRSFPAGVHTLPWNGRDEAGRRLASGVYFYRLEAGEFTCTRRTSLIR